MLVTRIRLGAVAALSAAALLPGHTAAARPATGIPVPPGPPAPHTSAAPHRAGPTARRPAGPSAAVPSPAGGTWTAEAAVRFWTRERMAAATDPSGRTAPPKGWSAAGRPSSAGLSGRYFAGIKSVGTLFDTGAGLRGHSCSAAVVRSTGHDLVLTAGHCVGQHAMFVPDYDSTKSAARQPYGVWAVRQWFRDKRYASDTSRNSDLDFAFAALQPNGTREVQDVVGGNTLARTPGFANKVTVIGYPKVAHNPQDQALRCPGVTTTAALPGYYQMRITCGGMWGGVSGGPWFSGFDASGDTGTIIGNVGGYNGGGPAVPPTDPRYNEITYSPLYGDRFFQLYDDAQQGANPDRGPYTQPPLPYSMGFGASWKHARLLAAGDFDGTGRSDLIVVRDDGRTTLYTGDGDGHFVRERQLLAKNSRWADARTVTAGDFTGSDRFDLLVRWADGEVRLYPDVGDLGLDRAGTRMAAPGGSWKNAVQLAAGRFGGPGRAGDLVVRWADGGLTLHTGVGAGTFGRGHRLKDPGATWQQAALMTGGEFSGRPAWDLLARWRNGELDTYAGTSAAGLGTAARIRKPNGLWTHGTVLAAGDFTGDHRTNDLVVRWSDGETTLYADTTGSRLGSEVALVPPA